MRKYLFILIFCFTANFIFATSVTVNNHIALVAAVNGTADTIFIDGTIVTSAEIIINRNLVLIGINNGTLDGNNSHRILSINQNDTLYMDSISMINGNAVGGGAIYKFMGVVFLKNMYFANNNSSSTGGAIFSNMGYGSNRGGKLFITKSVFINNNAVGEGGAIINRSYWHNAAFTDEFIITHSIFDGNSSGSYGGAISNYAGEAVVINSLFINNVAADGGAISCYEGIVRLLNSTLTKNTGTLRGGALGSYHTMPIHFHLDNTIVTGNTSPENDIFLNRFAFLYTRHNIIGSVNSTGRIYRNTQSFFGINPDSVFTDYLNDDFTLKECSWTVNAGLNGFQPVVTSIYNLTDDINIDLANNPRVVGDRIDIGAYEFQNDVDNLLYDTLNICQSDLPFIYGNTTFGVGTTSNDTVLSGQPVNGCNNGILHLSLNITERPIYSFSDTICSNQTYNFKGQILNSSGVYNDTIDIGGCDSVVTLNLVVNQAYNIIINDTIFVENGYTQNNFSIPVQNSAGTVLDTLFLQSRNNCDSMVFLNLTVMCPSKTDTINATICETETYPFANRNLNLQGSYNDTLQTQNGCDSIVTLNLRVNSVYSQTQNITICDYELPYFYGDSVFYSSGIKNVVFQTIYGCDSVIVVNLIAQTSEIQYDTLVICADLLPYTYNDTTFQIGTRSGNYQLQDMCSGVILNLNILPQTQTFFPDIPIVCADGNNLILEFPSTNEINTKPPTNYDIVFDNEATTAGFENQSGDFGNDNKIIVQMPEKIYPDYYNFKIILSDNIYNCAQQEFYIEIPVLYPDSIMVQKWGNVISLLNYHYNGGFDFSGYQWFKNGQIMAGKNHSYIYIGEGESFVVGDKYSVLLTRPDGSQMFSCDFAAREPHEEISKFPTVVSPNGTIRIPQQDNAMVRLITVTGITLSSYQSSTNEITAPAQQGIYLLEILSNNSRQVVKIVVK